MLRMGRIGSMCLTAAAMLVAFCGGCDNNSFSAGNLPANQAQAVANDVSLGIFNVLFGAFQQPAGAPAAEKRTHPVLLSVARHVSLNRTSVIATSTPETVPISGTYPCPVSGNITVAGSAVVTLDNTGSGTGTASLTVTPNDCGVTSTLVIAGDPNVTITDPNLSVVNGDLGVPASYTASGTITAATSAATTTPAGTTTAVAGTSQVCTYNVTVMITALPNTTDPNPTGTYSGTVCGTQVSGALAPPTV